MIFFLYGPDTYRSRQKLKSIKEKFIRDVDKSSLNIEVLDGSKLEPADFEKAINTMPFLAKKRLVIIEDLISKNKGQKIQKEILTSLDKSQLDTTILVFWESGVGGSKSKKSKSKLGSSRSHILLVRLQKEKYAQAFNLLSENEVYRFATDEIKQRGSQIQPAALKLLADLVGNDLWQMNSEIDKLIAFAKNRPIIVSDIESLVKNKLDEDIFKLTEALGQKNKKLALKLIADQLKGQAKPTEILTKMTWQFKNLLTLRSFFEKNGSGYGAERLGYQLGLHPFVVKKTMAQIKNYNLANLKKIYQNLLSIDYKIKTSQMDPEVLFDLLVIKS